MFLLQVIYSALLYITEEDLTYTVEPPSGSVITGFEGDHNVDIFCVINEGEVTPVWTLLTEEDQNQGRGPSVIDVPNDERFSYRHEGPEALIVEVLTAELNNSIIFCHETDTPERLAVANFTLFAMRKLLLRIIVTCEVCEHGISNVETAVYLI